MEKRVYAYDKADEYMGYVRLDTDDTGKVVGEVYDPKADKLGAVQLEPLRDEAEESLVHDPGGEQVAYLRLERYEGDTLGADVHWIGTLGTEDEVVAHVHYDPQSGRAEYHKKAEWGEQLGWLKPENVSPEELVLVGGGAGLLILM